MILVLYRRRGTFPYRENLNLSSLINIQSSIEKFERGLLRPIQSRRLEWTVEKTNQSKLQPRISTSLVYTCRQIYSEARQIIYAANRFRFSCQIAFSTFTKTLSRTNMANIRYLDIHARAITGEELAGVVEGLQKVSHSMTSLQHFAMALIVREVDLLSLPSAALLKNFKETRDSDPFDSVIEAVLDLKALPLLSYKFGWTALSSYKTEFAAKAYWERWCRLASKYILDKLDDIDKSG